MNWKWGSDWVFFLHFFTCLGSRNNCMRSRGNIWISEIHLVNKWKGSTRLKLRYNGSIRLNGHIPCLPLFGSFAQHFQTFSMGKTLKRGSILRSKCCVLTMVADDSSRTRIAGQSSNGKRRALWPRYVNQIHFHVGLQLTLMRFFTDKQTIPPWANGSQPCLLGQDNTGTSNVCAIIRVEAWTAGRWGSE